MPFKINLPNKIALLPIIAQVVRHFKGVSFPLFLVSITQAITNLTINLCEKCPFSIRWDSNPRPPPSRKNVRFMTKFQIETRLFRVDCVVLNTTWYHREKESWPFPGLKSAILQCD